MAHRTITTQLDLLQPLMQRGISLPAKISWDSFKAHEEIRAAKVKEYRDFADGEHDVELSQEMKDMLRTDSLYMNHCENILETLSDRLRLSAIQVTVKGADGEPNEAATDEANKWIEKLTQEWNRLDGLQIDVHDAIPRDGLAFIQAEFSETRKEVVWHVEEAFDGHSGVIVVWGDDGHEPSLAIKLWHETQRGDKSQLIDNVRINLYFADRIEKYIAVGSKLAPYQDDDGQHIYDWTMADGSPIGVAVIPFVYKGRRYNKHGLGRLENVIPMQRAINRVFNSLIMTSEHIGFPIRYALGMDLPTTIKPGTWLKVTVPYTVTENGKTRTLSQAERQTIMEAIVKIRVGQIEPAQLDGLISEINQILIPHMYVISGTPYPEGSGANISGEALKQLDIRLVGTAQRCQTGWGNSWEDLVKLSARIEATYGMGAPWDDELAIVSAKWESAEVRDDAVVIANVKSTVDIVPELDNRTRLEMMASVHGWDNARIDEIEKRINDEADAGVDRELQIAANGNGGFGAFGAGIDLGDPLNPSQVQQIQTQQSNGIDAVPTE